METLKKHYDALLNERDIRYMQLSRSAQEAIEVAKNAAASNRAQIMAVIALAVTVLIASLSGIGAVIFYMVTHNK